VTIAVKFPNKLNSGKHFGHFKLESLFQDTLSKGRIIMERRAISRYIQIRHYVGYALIALQDEEQGGRPGR
jgi:hypothetical protein